MNKVASLANLKLAFKAVKRNKGAPGIDNITISQMWRRAWCRRRRLKSSGGWIEAVI